MTVNSSEVMGYMIWAYSLMCLIYGTTFLGIRAGDEAGMPPFLFAALRFMAAGVITLLFVLFRNHSAFPRRARPYLRFLSIGIFNTTLVFAIIYYVEQYVPSAYAALMGATMPFMVMIMSRITHKQTITGLQVIGLVMGFFGVLAIAWPGLQHAIPHWIPYTLTLIASQIFAAIGSIQSKTALEDGTSPFIVNGFQVLFGGIGLLILACFTNGLSLSNVHSLPHAVEALVYLTVFGSIIASTIFFWLIKRTGALIASTWTYVSPAIAIVVGYIWDSEPVYALTILGALVILAGVFLMNLQAFRGAYQESRAGRTSFTPMQKEPLVIPSESLTIKE